MWPLKIDDGYDSTDRNHALGQGMGIRPNDPHFVRKALADIRSNRFLKSDHDHDHLLVDPGGLCVPAFF
jgi:hypothetical protein